MNNYEKKDIERYTMIKLKIIIKFKFLCEYIKKQLKIRFDIKKNLYI